MAMMDKRVRDIYLIYLGLNETVEVLNDGQKHEFLWYKGNIIELNYVNQFLKDLK